MSWTSDMPLCANCKWFDKDGHDGPDRGVFGPHRCARPNLITGEPMNVSCGRDRYMVRGAPADMDMPFSLYDAKAVMCGPSGQWFEKKEA